MIIGYTCGVYDLLHVGHINLLKNARAMCDKLIVGLSTDEATQYKFKNTILKYDDRKQILESLKYVDSVIPQEDTDKVLAWNKIKFNILFVGDDWYNTPKWNQFEKELKQHNVKLVYFPYTKSSSTTLIKKKIVNINNIFIIFDLDKTLWNFYTNLLTDNEYNNIINNYQFSNDIIRIFNFLNKNNIEYGFASRSKYKDRCSKLLNKLGVNLDNHYNHIEWTENKSKLPHIQNIIKNSGKSPEFMLLFDDDNENLNSVRHLIKCTKLVNKEVNLQFEDFIDVLYEISK